MDNQGFRPIISNGCSLRGAVLCLRQEVEMKMSALAGLALVVVFGILLSSCGNLFYVCFLALGVLVELVLDWSAPIALSFVSFASVCPLLSFADCIVNGTFQ